MATGTGHRWGPRVRWVVTDRTGGASAPPYDSLNLADHVGDDPSAVSRNRAVLARSLALPPERLVFLRPTHGRDVAVVTDVGEPWPTVDALVTSTPGIGLVTLGADCVPLLLADTRNGVVAAVHAGWRGVRLDVAGAALAAMADLGADLSAVRAVLGPAICGGCYDVPPQRRAEVAAVAPDAASTTADGRPSLDLRAGIRARLGPVVTAIESVGGCTYEDPGLFSFRRDPVTGRQAAAILLTQVPS